MSEPTRWSASNYNQCDNGGFVAWSAYKKIDSEFRASQAREAELRKKLEAAEVALTPKPLPEGLVPHAYGLASTIQNAEYWYKAGHNEPDTGKAVLCMAQAMFAWKNAALAKAEDAMKAEALIKASQEQEPVAEVSPSSNGSGIIGVKWGGLNVGMLKFGDKLYAAPIIQPELAELQHENSELTRKLEEQDEEFERQEMRMDSAKLLEAKVQEGMRLVPDEILFGIVGSFGHGRAKHVSKLSELLGVSQPPKEQTCARHGIEHCLSCRRS